MNLGLRLLRPFNNFLYLDITMAREFLGTNKAGLRRGFTLIELIIVIGIIGILATITVLALNPSETQRQARDAVRLAELRLINIGLSIYATDNDNPFLGNPMTVYLSLPDDQSDCGTYLADLPELPTSTGSWGYSCVSEDNLRSIDGTGWLPIDFSSIKSSPFSSLPIDSINDAGRGLYYSYIYDSVSGTWELNAKMESEAFMVSGNKDAESTDGGDTAVLYESGSALDLIPVEINDRNISGAGGPSSDTIPPGVVVDLVTTGATQTSVDLEWTATGDDGGMGTATTYDLRYSTNAITSGNWGSATQVSGEPGPHISGFLESMTVSGLTASTGYYFGIKVSDEEGNESSLSNIANITTPSASQEITVLISASSTAEGGCYDTSYGGGDYYEFYTPWTIPGSGSVAITKVWFWQSNSTLGSGESVKLALYEYQDTYNNNGTSFEKISESVSIFGTGSSDWVNGSLSSPIPVNLGQTYIFGIAPGPSSVYFIPQDANPFCAGYAPSVGGYYTGSDGNLNMSVPTGTQSNTYKYGMVGISYFLVDSGDITPPNISGISVGNLTDTSALISWDTNEPANSAVDFGIDTFYGTSVFNGAYLNSHEIDLINLERNTTYHYRVGSTDLSGNEATSSDFVFTTTNLGPDVDPPTVSINSPSDGSQVNGVINVQGSSSDNRGVVSVEVAAGTSSYSLTNGTSSWSFSLDTNDFSDGLTQIISRATDTSGNTSTDLVSVTIANNEISLTDCGVLDIPGATYTLQNNVSSSRTCFVVGASNIILDLNSYEVRFGTDGSYLHTYGVAIPPGYISPSQREIFLDDVPSSTFVGADNVVIKNGSIIHGLPSGEAAASSSVILSVEGHSGMEVANIYAYYQGADSSGIGFVEDWNVNVHDNVVEGNLNLISNRHHAQSAIGISKVRGYVYVRNNNVYGNGQFGISVTSKKVFGNSVTGAEISGNQMRINGITTNPYQLVVTGFSKRDQGITLRIFNNTIEAPGIGAGSISNRGMLLEGIDSSAEGIDGALVYNNYIDTKEHGNQEYGEEGWTHAFRMRDPDYDIVETKFFNNEFYNNTFKARAYYVSGVENGNGYGIRITLRDPIPAGEGPNLFHDNTIIAETTSPLVESKAIDFEGHHPGAATVFRDNTIITNSIFLNFSWQGGSGVLFDSNDISMGASPMNFTTINYNNAGSSTDNIFLDNNIDPSIDLLNIDQWVGGPNDGRTFLVKWSLSIDVEDQSAQPIAGAQVEIRDKNDNLVFNGLTNANGIASTTLAEYHYDVNSAIKTNYNPYTVTVSKTGYTDNVQQVTMDASKSLNMVLNP